jgi:hypothetical protein
MADATIIRQAQRAEVREFPRIKFALIREIRVKAFFSSVVELGVSN